MTDATPAKADFTIDTTAPTTKITKEPAKHTHDRTPKFKFKSDDPDATFECKTDGGKHKPCDSPDTLGRLSHGRHTFEVRADDATGNVDGEPAKDRFKVLG
jgi:hypothetical protein